MRRHPSIHHLSRDHHHALLLCWKIREGLKKKLDLTRIKDYADWFWENHLKAHFETEEKYAFTVLDRNNRLIQRAFEEHQLLRSLFHQDSDLENTLATIAQELDNHIRFEERVLFDQIEKAATEEQLKLIDKHHHHTPFSDDWNDKFWK